MLVIGLLFGVPFAVLVFGPILFLLFSPKGDEKD
jgi:hypothetical protein